MPSFTFQNQQTEKGAAVVATLRLFRILLRYGGDLQETFTAGFQETPTAPWKEIIPQLFARLDHPENYVRTQLLDLISKLGQESPHLVVYPTVVGLATENRSDSTQATQLESTFSGNELTLELNNVLLSQQPQLVAQVQLLIEELTRITSLFEEHWMVTLQRVIPFSRLIKGSN